MIRAIFGSSLLGVDRLLFFPSPSISPHGTRWRACVACVSSIGRRVSHRSIAIDRERVLLCCMCVNVAWYRLACEIGGQEDRHQGWQGRQGQGKGRLQGLRQQEGRQGQEEGTVSCVCSRQLS